MVRSPVFAFSFVLNLVLAGAAPRAALVAENLLLGQQLTVASRGVKRPRLRRFNRWLLGAVAGRSRRLLERAGRTRHKVQARHWPRLERSGNRVSSQTRPFSAPTARSRTLDSHPGGVPPTTRSRLGSRCSSSAGQCARGLSRKSHIGFDGASRQPQTRPQIRNTSWIATVTPNDGSTNRIPIPAELSSAFLIHRTSAPTAMGRT